MKQKNKSTYKGFKKIDDIRAGFFTAFGMAKIFKTTRYIIIAFLLLFAVHCLLFIVHCSLFVVHAQDEVSGWRWQRKDSLSKRIFSRGADRLRKIF